MHYKTIDEKLVGKRCDVFLLCGSVLCQDIDKECFCKLRMSTFSVVILQDDDYHSLGVLVAEQCRWQPVSGACQAARTITTSNSGDIASPYHFVLVFVFTKVNYWPVCGPSKRRL